MNPMLVRFFLEIRKVCHEAKGSCSILLSSILAPALARVAGPAVASTWAGSALLPATLAYSTVKGVGWYDWGNSGLNDHEMKLNGLTKEQ